MNFVIVISNVYKDTGKDPIFSPNDRIGMLTSEIDTIRKKIPDSYIIIMESIPQSSYEKEYFNYGSNYEKNIIEKIDKLFPFGTNSIVKLNNLYMYFSLAISTNTISKIKTITVISEGLSLTENFSFDEWPLSSNVIQYKNDTFNPIFYRFPIAYLSTFYKKLQVAMKGEGTIGDLFLKHEVFTLENTIHDIPKLNLSGWNDTTGAYFEV
jgi:hypothetical protein